MSHPPTRPDLPQPSAAARRDDFLSLTCAARAPRCTHRPPPGPARAQGPGVRLTYTSAAGEEARLAAPPPFPAGALPLRNPPLPAPAAA